MSAQQEQTERATPAAAPAAAKQYRKGVVKQVMDGGAVVIRGPPRNGPPPEMTLALTNIDAPRLARRKTANAEATEVRNIMTVQCRGSNQIYQDQPFAWEAREYLRKMIVGKQVLGHVVHQANNRCVGTF